MDPRSPELVHGAAAPGGSFVGQADLFSGGSGGSASDTMPDLLPDFVVQAPHVAASSSRAPVTVSGASRVIQDAGEELTYNRRNRVKTAKGWDDISRLNDSLKVKETVKSAIWPKPDFQQLITDGMQPIVAHIVKQVYDSVAVKPMIGARGALDDLTLQKYITALNRIEKGLMHWSRDREALKQWTNANLRVAGAMLGQRISIAELAAEPRSLLDAIYPEGWKACRDEVILAGGNKLLGALQPGHDEIKRAMKAINEGWPAKREAWEVQGYRIVENPNAVIEKFSHKESFFLTVEDSYLGSFDSLAEAEALKAQLKSFGLFSKRVMVGSFLTEQEAVDAAKLLTRRDKGSVIGEKGVSVEAVEREGVNRRIEGEDISSERLMLEFGLKGVNFGNWLKTPSAKAEAQLHLNHAFDSLHDLAEILNVPPKAMSLNGMLGLAIGAQGGGSHAAHFVPGVNEINLTRSSGAGSLAHEYGHALDHYFATQAGLASKAEPFLTEHALLGPVREVTQLVDGKYVAAKVPRFGELRPEIATAFSTIVDLMEKRLNTKDEAKASQNAQLEKSKKNVAGWLKSIRRDFAGQEDAFDVLAARVQAGDVGDGKIAISRAVHISPAVAEIRDLYKAAHERVYSLENIKGLQAWVDSAAFQQSKLAADADHVPQKVASDFSINARALDLEKGGKPYWSTKLEKFARAFDAFVSDGLVTRHAKNGYLSHTGATGERVPMGAERQAINGAFQGLINEFKVRETAQGVALFSAGQVAAATAMPVSSIAAEIERLKGQWREMPKVTVVNAASDLPFEAPANADGAYYDGQVYVVAGNIADLKQLQKVMAHECVMHHSLIDMLGPYGFSKLQHGIQKLKEADDPVVTALAENIQERYGDLPPDIETHEIVARAGEQCLDAQGNVRVEYGFMKGVFAGVAGWLRDHGMPVAFTNIELQGIMHGAGQWVKQGRDGASAARSMPSAVGRGADEFPKEGSFNGKILADKDGVVVQKIGRGGQVIRHAQSRLTATVTVGDVVDIQYQRGLGVVSGPSRELAR